MKNAIFFIICFSLLQTSKLSSQEVKESVMTDDSQLTLLTTPELSSLIGVWASAFEKANQGIRVSVSTSDTELSPADKNRADLVIVKGDEVANVSGKTAWTMVVGRDIVVPVINSNSPYIDEICRTGISAEKMRIIFSGMDETTWEMLLGGDPQKGVHSYLVRDEWVISALSGFLNLTNEDIRGKVAENAGEMLAALQKDPYGIGFCKLTDVTDLNNQQFMSNIRLIPIDINSNGQLDFFEDIYSDLGSFTRGVYIGKYPKVLYNNIFTVSERKPTSGSQLAFIRWLLADGQQFLAENGYERLAGGEGTLKVAELDEKEASFTTVRSGPTVFEAFLKILAGMTVLVLILYAISRFVKASGKEAPVFESIHQTAFSEKSLIIPRGFFFDKTHTWVYMEKDGDVRIGVDDFLQHVTGTITRLKMKSHGDKVTRGEYLLSLIQDGKQLNICSPVSGRITSVNGLLIRNSSVLNTSPYSEGWIYKIEPDNWLKEMRMLIMAERYSEWIRDEFSRLKDFLGAILAGNKIKLSAVVLQDGGELKESLLEDFGPEVWEDFQTGFLDKAR